MSSDSRGHTRRRILKSLGAASTAGLAGCGGGGQRQTDTPGDGPGPDEDTATEMPQAELGERVPQVGMSYWSNWPKTQIIEQKMQIAGESIREDLGVRIKIDPVEFATQIASIVGDKRDWTFPHILYNVKPRRFTDITDMLNSMRLGGPGSYGAGGGLGHYVSPNACEYTRQYQIYTTSIDEEERQQAVNKARNIATKDVAVIPFTNSMVFNAYRTDKIDGKGLGKMGVDTRDPNFFIQSSPKEGDTFVAETDAVVLGSAQPTRRGDSMQWWSNLVHSGLRMFDKDLRPRNVLANSVETERDGKRVIVEIVDGASFHNGDALTAEDVAWSFRYVQDYNAGATEIPLWPHDSIEVLDDRTVQFNLTTTSPTLTNTIFSMTGIWHKESMVEAGATENPAEYTFDSLTDIVGSGPFRITSGTLGESALVEPFEDHPVFDVDHKIQFRVFDNKQTAIQAYKAGELHTIFGLQPLVFEQFKKRDDTKAISRKAWTIDGLWTQFSFPPGKFKAFRQAVGVTIDRKKMNQIAYGGRAEPQLHGSSVPTTNAWHEEGAVDNIEGLESPSGNPENARQILRDAGWGWDDNDNLHYPADADLSPRWPEGESASPEKYPCLTEEWWQKGLEN